MPGWYSLSAAFGVAPEDDDGNAAAKAAPKKPATKPETKTEHKPSTTPDQEKYFPRIKAALDILHGSDVAAKKAVIKHLTTFEGADGKEVADIEDYRKLDGKRLQILAHKLEAIVEKGNKQWQV